MAKQIDPVDIKNAIKSGQLKVIVKKERGLLYKWETYYYIYIKDTENGDTVLIARFDASEVEE